MAMKRSLFSLVSVLTLGVFLVGCATDAENGDDTTDEEASVETSLETASSQPKHDYKIDPEDKVELVANEGEQLTSLTVSNVTCSGCTMTILKQVMAVEGVRDCQFDDINTAEGSAVASIVFDPEKTDVSAIVAAIDSIENEEYTAVENSTEA